MPSSTDNLASRLRQSRRARREQRVPVDGSARELIVVAFAVPVVVLVAIAVVIGAVLLFASSGLQGYPAAVGASWLALHQVPITISAATIGVLPLLPTLLMAAGTARMAASASDPERPHSELVAVFCSAVGGPLLLTALSLAVVMDGSSVMPLQCPSALQAFGYTLGVHAAAAAVGIGWRCRDELPIPAPLRLGARQGAVALAALFSCGAVLVVVRLVLRWHVVGDLLAGGDDFDGHLGLTALSILYLPNIVVGAVAVLVGANAHLGVASVDMLGVHGGPVPPLPVLGVLPESGLGTVGIVGFVVPLVIAVLVGLRCRNTDLVTNLRSVAVAGAVSASVMVMLSLMAGGQLGEFGDAGMTVPTVGVFTLGWIVVVGGLIALVHSCLPSTRAARAEADDSWTDDDWIDETDEYGYDDEYLTAEEFDAEEFDAEEFDAEEFDDAFADADEPSYVDDFDAYDGDDEFGDDLDGYDYRDDDTGEIVGAEPVTEMAGNDPEPAWHIADRP